MTLLATLALAGCSMYGTDNDNTLSGHTQTVVTGTSDNATDNTSAATDDAKFVSWAMAANEVELDLVRIGKLTLVDADLKSQAGAMETAHGTVGQELANYASKKGIKLSNNDADDANDMIKDQADDLNDYATGAAFDKAWVAKAIDMHEDAIAKYKKAGSDVEDQELKDWISKTIP